jgi:pimeloyl-ACP methyl ester carboxylesterase
MKIKKWLKRIGLSVLLLIVLALITGVAYEQIGRQQAKKYKKSRVGNVVDVGGHKLYYEKKGEGDVTVVFESGAPMDHRVWNFLSDTISKYATTITYDRAGLLWSERGDNAKTAVNISADLENLLTKISAPKPYVLVGHSAAGIYFRSFISDNQNAIQGVVLIDPSHPNQMSNATEEIKEVMQPPFFPPKWLVFFANEIGLPRLFSRDPLAFRSLKSGGAMDEMDYLMNHMEHDISNLPSETWSIPLVVISAGKFNSPQIKTEELKTKMRNYWSSLQIETSQLSSQGERIVAEKSGHNMLYSERELITSEILKMIHLKDSVSTK